METSQVLLVQTEKGTMVNELVHNSTFVALISVSYKVQGSGLCEQGISPAKVTSRGQQSKRMCT